MNDTFDTFAEQASCFSISKQVTSSISPVGIRLGDRLTGRPIHVDISDEPSRKVFVLTATNSFLVHPAAASHFSPTTGSFYYEQEHTLFWLMWTFI